MTAWFTGGDVEAPVEESDMARYYAPLSWHCLLAGFGTFPDEAKIKPLEPELSLANLQEIDDFLARCTANFQPHRTPQ